MIENPNTLSLLVINLMKGVLYQDKQPSLWNALLNLQSSVRDYVTLMNLELYIDETEGYAFLRQQEALENDENQAALPRLIQRRPLSYSVSLLCLLLRKKLIENDASSGNTRVIITHQQIQDMMSLFLPERANQIKTIEQIETCINKMLDYGFLRRLKNDDPHYEIQRIIKAFINADWLTEIDSKLKTYKDYGQEHAD